MTNHADTQKGLCVMYTAWQTSQHSTTQQIANKGFTLEQEAIDDDDDPQKKTKHESLF